MTALGMYPLDRSTPSLLRAEPLFRGAPAPVGTLFVLSDDGGYAAAPARANRLILGRNTEDVHVTIGAGDGRISRQHATLRSDGRTWLLQNDGRLPIRIPDVPELLHGHEAPLSPGYTPLYLSGTHRHVVEILVSEGRATPPVVRPQTSTTDLRWPLTNRERLVLVAMFQNYLERSDNPRPLSWSETSNELNDVPGQEGKWNDRKAEYVVEGLRKKLTEADRAAVNVESVPPEVIRLNLLRYLLETATLVPPDLRLLKGTD